MLVELPAVNPGLLLWKHSYRLLLPDLMLSGLDFDRFATAFPCLNTLELNYEGTKLPVGVCPRQ